MESNDMVRKHGGSSASEGALRESEQMFRTLIERSVLGIVVIQDLRILFANPAAAEIVGLTIEEILSLSPEEVLAFVVREDRAVAEEVHKDRLAGRPIPSHQQYRLVRRDGTTFWVEVTVSPIELGGRPASEVAFVDITDRKRADEMIQRAHDELEDVIRQRTADLTEANRRLKREITLRRKTGEELRQLQSELAHVARVSTMGEMATGLAHELNQPLAAAAAYAGACSRLTDSDQPDLAEIRETSRKVAAQVHRAGEIIRRLRSFVRKRSSQRSSTDLNKLVHAVVELMAHEAHTKGVSVRLELAQDLPPVLVDSIQIQQVVLNLARNSIEALTHGSVGPCEIKVRTALAERDMLVVSVRDSGPGLSKEIADQIFEPFFSTKPEGMGMGLSISRSIIEDHGGRIGNASRAGGGTVFQFTLPIEDPNRRRHV